MLEYTISQIEVDIGNPKVSDAALITIDIDWAPDIIIQDVIEVFERFDVSATWFITHRSPILERLRENKRFELGIHPNFNNLLMGNYQNGRNIEEVVDRLLEIVPNAKSVRSHSMTQNGRLHELFSSKGLTHESNDYIPFRSNIELRPWHISTGLIKVPCFWADDEALVMEDIPPIRKLAHSKGLKVFNFHPMHIFLNSENTARLRNSRHLYHSPDGLKQKRYYGNGIRNTFTDLLTLSKNTKVE